MPRIEINALRNPVGTVGRSLAEPAKGARRESARTVDRGDLPCLACDVPPCPTRMRRQQSGTTPISSLSHPISWYGDTRIVACGQGMPNKKETTPDAFASD